MNVPFFEATVLDGQARGLISLIRAAQRHPDFETTKAMLKLAANSAEQLAQDIRETVDKLN